MLTFGNRKLPTTTAIFNLPAVKTCPGSTPECREWCYARKAEKMYPQVLPFREKNLIHSIGHTFVQEIQEELIKKKKVDTIRIHESGDFYNQGYFDKWCKLARIFSDKIFYAYTKNKNLDLTNKPKNFILLLSDDNEDFKKDWKLYNGVAKVSTDKNFSDDKWFVCPGSCKTCNYCYVKTRKKKRIVFKVH